MTSESYWARRAEKRLWEALEEAEEAANDVAKAYRASARYLQQEARKVMRTFARKSGLTEREALRILKLAGSGDLRAIKKALARMSANPSVKELETILSSPAYAARIKRFESLLSDVQKQTVNLRQLQAEAVRRTLVDTVAGTYYKTIFDLQQRSGAAFSFDAVSPQYIETILDEKIAGKNYSERIWRNTDKLAQKLREQLLMDAMTGASEAKSARRLAETMHASVADARRLIRTETTRAANNASLESFKRCRIKRYQFVATLDLRTSELCAELDGKEFDISEAKVGVNLPPMHPYCRSIVGTVFTAEERARMQRAARDPKTGKSIRVPADMTYKEWYDKYVKDMPSAEGAIKAARNKNADRRQYEKYRAVLGSKAPKSLEKFQEIKYNNSEKWKELKGFKKYKEAYPETSLENYRVYTVLRDKGLLPKGHIVPTQACKVYILADAGKKNSAHIMERMLERNIASEAVQSYVDNSILCVSMFQGTRKVFYSEDGVTVLTQTSAYQGIDWIAKTTWSKSDFDDNTTEIIKEVKRIIGNR